MNKPLLEIEFNIDNKLYRIKLILDNYIEEKLYIIIYPNDSLDINGRAIYCFRYIIEYGKVNRKWLSDRLPIELIDCIDEKLKTYLPLI